MITKPTLLAPGKNELDALSKIVFQDMLNDSGKDLTTEFSLVMRLMNGVCLTHWITTITANLKYKGPHVTTHQCRL